NILSEPNLLKIRLTDNPEKELILSSIHVLLNLIHEEKILTIVKDKKSIQSIIKLTNLKNHHIQFAAYRILANIMDDKNLNETLVHSNKLKTFFIDPLQEALNQECKSNEFISSLLLTLKELIQHKVIEQELVEQNGLTVLAMCINEDNPLILRISLDILSKIITTNQQAAQILMQNDTFVAQLKSLITSSYDDDIIRKMARLICTNLGKDELRKSSKDWSTANVMAVKQFFQRRQPKRHEDLINIASTEANTISDFVPNTERNAARRPPSKSVLYRQQVEETSVYIGEGDKSFATTNTTVVRNSKRSYVNDIMISYSHKDQQLCHQIYDQLIKHNFRVWIDKQNMHVGVLQSMSSAVENSEIVLLCMSDAYVESPSCEQEANYAWQLKRHLIPLKVKKKFKADGWLGILISGKIYIDFTKTSFDDAFTKLLDEIQHHQQKELFTLNIATNSSVNVEQQITERSFTSYTDKNIECWTKEDVSNFFKDEPLHIMKPLFENMDGQALIEFYNNYENGFEETSYQSLCTQLYQQPYGVQLPVNSYYIFLGKLKRYIPVEPIIHTSSLPPRQRITFRDKNRGSSSSYGTETKEIAVLSLEPENNVSGSNNSTKSN
ncbi:unnamed protein product, partial [Didymodactylos carnosus]